MENDMPNWAPTTFDQNTVKLQYHDNPLMPLEANTLAEWNLSWLFDYKALSNLDGTVAGMTRYHKAVNPNLNAAITVDVRDNLYGIKDLAETLGPVEFLTTYMRKPYQHTTIFSMCGDAVFKEARNSAEKLALSMQGRVEGACREAANVLQTAKILAFKRPA